MMMVVMMMMMMVVIMMMAHTGSGKGFADFLTSRHFRVREAVQAVRKKALDIFNLAPFTP